MEKLLIINSQNWNLKMHLVGVIGPYPITEWLCILVLNLQLTYVDNKI